MKETFKLFIQNSIEEKQKLLLSNSINDEDKALIQEQIDNLTAMVEKVDALEEGEQANEAIEELKQTVNEMGEKLVALNEKLNQKNNEENIENKMEDTLKNYLESKNAIHDFAEAIRNSKNADEFKNNWDAAIKNAAQVETIAIEKGSEEAYLPSIVKGMISDIWDRNADWLKDLNYTGAKRFFCRYNDSKQVAETSRAKGYKKGQTKVKQELEFSSKLLEAQFIYKIATISLQTKFEDDGSLITYVVKELTDQILYEIKRAILVGDGRRDDDDYKISTIEAIGKDVSDSWTNVTQYDSSLFLVDQIREVVDGLHNPTNKAVYVFLRKADLRTLARLQASETSTPVYMSTEQVAEQLGCDRIITTDLLGTNYKAIAMIPSEYYMVGAPNLLSPILYTWHDGWTNTDCYRNETVVGGGINGLQSTGVLYSGQ